jgi:demethylmenaquinone methyltransferase/2-methoxy-6-polyprenyl-1,4-benzoquinol methylase
VDAGHALTPSPTAVPFRATFDCLWCGTPHTCRGSDDLEGWASLCPACLGKAGDNGFLRFRLRQAIEERGRTGTVAAPATVGEPTSVPAAPPGSGADVTDPEAALIPYYDARAAEYDDWYLRRGRYARGPIHDAAWNAELDAAGRWLDGLPIRGEIVDLAAGTGWWSTLLAEKGELSLYDANAAPLERARERLLAHGLRAHLHVRDARAEPDRAVDAVFTSFWLSHVPRSRLVEFLGLTRRWLKPGGRLAFIDSLPDPQSSAADHPAPSDDFSLRRLDDGREFTIVKVYYTPDELVEALDAAGFTDASVTTTGRFFLLGTATA